ncbi:MAG: CIA30 family protein [Spirochaetes bacterium]|nr:CIA30 family protein [Spirochaetota bacterium]
MKIFKIFIFVFFLLKQLFILSPEIIDWNYKGASITGYYYNTFNNIYVYRTIDYLKSLGVNSIAIVVTWYQDDFDSIKISRHEKKTIDDNNLIEVIQYCHKHGLKVNLKPHVDPYPINEEHKWRAKIKPSNIKEWFEEFDNFILHYFKIANDYDVELFTVATEMISMTKSKYFKYWQSLIKKLRANNYKGQITYSAHQFETFGSKDFGNKALDKNFWSLFDLISITTYYYSTISWEIYPDYKMLEKEWLDWKIKLEKWKKKLNIDKKVIFGETGYRSIDFTHKAPWQTFGVIKKGCNNFNEELQANCYKAMFNAIDKITWIDGIFLWQEEITSPPIYRDENNLKFSIINKLSSNVLKKYFSLTNEPYNKLSNNEIRGDWYYYNDNDNNGKSKIIINGNETLNFELILKEINGNMKQVSILSGIVTDDYQYGFIGIGLNLSVSMKEKIKKVSGVKLSVISNQKEFECRFETNNIIDNSFYKTLIKTEPNTLTDVTILFQDLIQYDFGNKKPFLKDRIEDISFKTVNCPIENVSIEIFDLEFIE